MVDKREIADSFDDGVAEGISMVIDKLGELVQVLEHLEDNATNNYKRGKGSYFEGQSDAFEHAVRLVEELIYIFSDDEKPTL